MSCILYLDLFTDFDGDNYIGKEDLECAVNCLTRNELSLDEVEFICEKVRTYLIKKVFVFKAS